jgi:hypothetical protein
MTFVYAIYGVAMILGTRSVLEASYGVLFAPASRGSDLLPRGVVVTAFVAVMLLAFRFFWVPRSVEAYLRRSRVSGDLFRRAILHITVTFVHAVLFFFVCHAFKELAEPLKAPKGVTEAQLAVRFVAAYAALLALNSGWLFSITPARDPVPGRIWSTINAATVALAVYDLGVYWYWHASGADLVGTASAIFIVSSGLDLFTCAQYYILFEPLQKVGAPAMWRGG